jgi:hypothetical protein
VNASAPEQIERLRRTYFDGDRLVRMPRAGAKRRVLLEYLVTQFEPGRHYTEVEVNAVLRATYDDVAALRRYLVEAELLDRTGGEYWRCGGFLDVG